MYSTKLVWSGTQRLSNIFWTFTHNLFSSSCNKWTNRTLEVFWNIENEDYTLRNSSNYCKTQQPICSATDVTVKASPFVCPPHQNLVERESFQSSHPWTRYQFKALSPPRGTPELQGIQEVPTRQVVGHFGDLTSECPSGTWVKGRKQLRFSRALQDWEYQLWQALAHSSGSCCTWLTTVTQTNG